jgi:ferric-dicitrate binding protein FerR (iron transport regulator)
MRGAWIIRQGSRLETVPKQGLAIGDELWTGPHSSAALGFLNGSTVYMQPNSHIRIGSVFAFVGELFIRVKGVFQVEMEFVTAAAEGTEYVIRVLPNNETECIVLQGRVRVASKSKRWPSFSVRATQQVDTRGERYDEIKAVSPGEITMIKSWVRQIDQQVLGER